MEEKLQTNFSNRLRETQDGLEGFYIALDFRAITKKILLNFFLLIRVELVNLINWLPKLTFYSYWNIMIHNEVFIDFSTEDYCNVRMSHLTAQISSLQVVVKNCEMSIKSLKLRSIK